MEEEWFDSLFYVTTNEVPFFPAFKLQILFVEIPFLKWLRKSHSESQTHLTAPPLSPIQQNIGLKFTK